ncbi:MAG: hypothetical protein JHC33_05700 [Ignisphaera sp.]|nr:hypothetical protein [Ignisphaera sp.]
MDKDISLIPSGIYCYEVGGLDRVCPYWSCEYTYEEIDWMKMRPNRTAKCSYLGEEVTGDILLDDQCKICGIKEIWDDDDEVITIN